MAPEALEGSAFGLIAYPEEEPLDEGLAGEQEGTEQATSTEPTQPPAGEPTEEQQPPEPGMVPEGGAPEPRQYAGKFGSVDALETGYNEAQAWGTRASQEAAELRRQMEQQQSQFAEMQQLLEALAPSILQQQMEANPELAEQLRQAQTVQAMVEQQVAPYRQQFEQLQQREQVSEAEKQAALQVGEWRARTGIQPNTPEDSAMAQAVTALDLDWRDPETGHLALDLALEASKDPVLLGVLQANPHLIEVEGGIEFARQQATVLKGVRPQVTAPATNGQQQHATAYVETGGQGAPTQGPPGGGKDEFDEAIAAWNEQKASPLFR